MRLLLVYGTTEGQTQKVAHFVADHLAQQGHDASVVNAIAAVVPEPREFDAVIIAASLHAGHYQSAIIHFVRKYLAAIDRRPNAFLSVSLAAASEDRDDIEGLERCVSELTQRTGWTPKHIHHVAGAFRYTSYDFMKKWAMKYIAYRKGAPTDTSCDHELTDWVDLTRFVEAFLAEIACQSGAQRK